MFRQPWKTGGEVLSEGVSNLMDRLLKKKQIEEEAKYKNALLGIANKKLPYELQHLSAQAQKEQEELESNRYFRSLWQDANQSPNVSTQSNPGKPTYTYGGSQSDQETDANIAANGNSYNPNYTASNKNIMLPKNNLTASFNPKVIQQKLDSGEEVIINPPRNPKLVQFDQFEGREIPGTKYKLPPIKSWDKDGIRYDRYPSGLVTGRKIAMSDEEKISAREKAQIEIAETKQKIKDKKEDDDFFKDMAEFADNNAAVGQIFKRNPAVTGVIPFAKKKFKMGQKDYAAVNRLTVPMVGDLAHRMNAKGSNYAIQMAQSGKFDPSQPVDYNMGILEANNDAIIRDYNRRAAAYKEKYGKEPPYKLSKYYKDWEKQHRASGNDESQSETKILNGKTYMKVNGTWHEKIG